MRRLFIDQKIPTHVLTSDPLGSAVALPCLRAEFRQSRGAWQLRRFRVTGRLAVLMLLAALPPDLRKASGFPARRTCFSPHPLRLEG
jgi:hypothetical protein